MISSNRMPSGTVSAQFNRSESRHDTNRDFVPCTCMRVCSSARRGGGVWSCLVRVPAIHAFQLDASCSHVEKWQVLSTSLVHSTVRSGAKLVDWGHVNWCHERTRRHTGEQGCQPGTISQPASAQVWRGCCRFSTALRRQSFHHVVNLCSIHQRARLRDNLMCNHRPYRSGVAGWHCHTPAQERPRRQRSSCTTSST